MDKKRLKARALACIMAASMCINMYPMSRVWADEEGTEGTEDSAIEEVTEEGQGEDLKAYFPNSYIQVQRLDSGATDAAIDGTNIFIVIGATDTEVR